MSAVSISAGYKDRLRRLDVPALNLLRRQTAAPRDGKTPARARARRARPLPEHAAPGIFFRTSWPMACGCGQVGDAARYRWRRAFRRRRSRWGRIG